MSADPDIARLYKEIKSVYDAIKDVEKTIALVNQRCTALELRIRACEQPCDCITTT